MLDNPTLATLDDLIEHAQRHEAVRLAVVVANQELVMQSVAQAAQAGLVEPVLIGDSSQIEALAAEQNYEVDRSRIIAANDDTKAARIAAGLARNGDVDAVMKGRIHTDTLMKALLDADIGLRLPGRRVSHVFVVDVPAYPKLLAITDAAINIAPDLNAKAQILQNAVSLLQVLGVAVPKVAALSAVETVNPAISSTVDAACLTLMAKRGQISSALVDGPMAFDNAISRDAANVKGMSSDVAGDVDILLVPDLVSGNILAKNLEYLGGAIAAGIVMGLSAPVVLSSRADPPKARLAAMALASLIYRSSIIPDRQADAAERESTIHCAAQPESACRPIC